MPSSAQQSRGDSMANINEAKRSMSLACGILKFARLTCFCWHSVLPLKKRTVEINVTKETFLGICFFNRKTTVKCRNVECYIFVEVVQTEIYIYAVAVKPTNEIK